MSCINRNLPEVKKLSEDLNISTALVAAKVGVWQSKNSIEDRFPTIEELRGKDNIVTYNLKSIDILSSDKAEKAFAKGKKNNWDLGKILTELQIPKEQKQIILDKYRDKVSEQEFIKSVFPDTKVKKILYHGTKDKEFSLKEKPKNWINQGNFFTEKEFEAKKYGDVVDVIINAKNIENSTGADFLNGKLLDNNKDTIKHSLPNYTGVKFETSNKFNNDGTYSMYATFKPEQIHILTKEEKSKIYNQDNLREEIITSLLAENSFVVEINTAKEQKFVDKNELTTYIYNNEEYADLGFAYYKNNNIEITEGEYRLAVKNGKRKFEKKEKFPTEYYSYLTVPGGTNYTENEVATPGIIPSIKGHGDFSTDNGIGWFRSDEEVKDGNSETVLNNNIIPEMDFDDEGRPIPSYQETIKTKEGTGNKTNTRRILEVQSDLFQKGRDSKDLVSEDDKINFEGYEEYKTSPKNNDNQFLQLLNKKGNWVNFFIQSIVQDSIKKGYEKVLFPTGETAAKVEGHQTIADDIAKLNKDIARINTLQIIENNDYESKNINRYKIVDPSSESHSLEKFSSNNKNDLENKIKDSIKNKEKAKEDMKTQGLEKLKPVEAFYTNRVTNILNKLYDVNEITDEHGNTWNEVDLSQAKASNPILFQKNQVNKDKTDVPFNLKESLINSNLINSEGKILNKTKLNKVIQNYKDISFFKYGFSVPDGTFKIINVTPNRSILRINDEFVKVISEEAEVNKEVENLTNDLNSASVSNYSMDKNLKENYFKDNAEQGLKSVLEKIGNSDHSLSELAKKVNELVGKADIPIFLVNKLQSSKGEDVAGQFDGNIKINENAVFKQGRAEAIILHEALHYLSFIELQDSSNEAVKDFEKVYDYAKKNLDSSMYGFTNLDEFLVALYTDSSFISELKKLPPSKGVKKYRNLFQQVLDLLSKLLNLSDNKSAFEQAFSISTNIVEKGSRRAADKYEAYLEFLDRNPQYENNEITFTKYAMAMLTNENSDKIDFSEETEAIEPLFQKVDTQTKQEKYSEKETSLKNSNEKLTSALEKSEIALKERIASLIHSAEMNKNKNKEKSQKLSQRADSLKEILLDLEKYRDKSKVTSALIFANEAKNNLSYLNNQLDNLDTNELSDLEFVLTFYENYIKSFSSIPVMKSVLSTYKARPDKSIEGIKDNELQEAIDVLTEVSTSFENVKNSFKDYQLSYVTKKLSDVKYFSNVEYRNRERLEKEYSANNIKGDKDTWVLRQMAGRDRERIQEEVEEEVNKLFNDPSKDISAMSASLGNGLKASDKLIQLYQHRLNEMQDREIQEDMEEDQRVKVLFRKLRDEKGTSNINKLFVNMIEFDSNKIPYLKSDYKLEVLEASKRMSTIRYKLQELEETDEEFNKLDKEYKALKTKYFVDKVDEFQVLDKYKNSYSNLSTIEKEVLDYFKSKNDEGNNTIYGRQGLNTYMYKNKNVVFYGLPKIYKSALERAYNGNILDEVKEGYKDLSTIRSDDVGFVNTEYDAAGKEVFKIPLHFRDGTGDNKMKAKDQSLDLFTIFRLEAKNINRYKNRREVELEFSTLLDVAYYKPIYLQKGSQNSKNVNTGKFEFTENAANSNMYKMLKNLNEQQFYDVLNKNGVKVPIVNLDANKVASKITGLASFVSLPLNLGQGFANVTNTKTQLFLESFIAGDIIKSKNIKNAEKFYAKHLGQTMADVTRPINESLVNQINEYFDLEGNLMGEAGDFLASTLAKKGLTKEAGQVAQSSGEHWIQSTIVLSVLDGIEVRDKNYNYINKEGKIVATEKEAASMLEMFSQDKNKKLVVSNKVVFTKFNKLTEFDKGGKTKIKMLIDNKTYDIVGNYKQKTRPEIYRHWYGKLFGMFRKYFYDSFNRRFKNIDNVAVNKEDLREDQRTFNSSLQEYEEGFYTSLVRFILSAIKSREMGMQALKAHWGTLSQHEKANITQASGEFALTLVIIPLLTSLLSAAFDDDDSAVLGFTLYQMRRLEMELSQFYSIPELLKILKSPVPATRLFKDFGDTIGVLFEMGDVLNGEDLVDPENFDKFIKNVGKRTPGVKEFMKDYHKIYNLSNKSSLGF